MSSSEPDWLARVDAVLQQVARHQATVTYNELAQQAGVPPPQRIHNLTLALERLVRRDHAAGRPLIALLAVSRAEGGIPGRGLFQLLTELGRYNGPDRGPQAAAQHSEECQAIWRHWQGGG